MTEPGNKEAVYFYDLPEDQQEIAINTPIGGPHYDFTIDNPNITKNWADGQLTWLNIIVRIKDDHIFDTVFKEFQIKISPEGPVYLSPDDLDTTSVIIIAPNGGDRGVIQFEETQYQFYEEDGLVKIPVQRVDGSDGDISVEYFVRNEKLPETATYGRDYKERLVVYLLLYRTYTA